MSIGLKEIKGTFYARIRRGKVERVVNLDTDNSIIARGRVEMVRGLEQEILDAGERVKIDWNSGRVGQISFPTLSELVERFLKHGIKSGVKANTTRTYKGKLNAAIEFIGADKRINQITKGLINDWRGDMLERGRTVATVNSNVIHFMAMWTWAGTLWKLPEVSIKKMKTTAGIRYIPDYLFDSILAEAEKINPILGWAYEFYRKTGARLREPYLADIFPMTLRVAADKSKGGRARIIPLLAGESDKVKELRAAYTPERLSRLFHLCSEAAGEAHRFHDLRHTAGVLIYIETRDIMEVKHRLGHATLSMSERYTTFDYYQLREDFPDRFAGEASRLKMAR
jgi:integrase